MKVKDRCNPRCGAKRNIARFARGHEVDVAYSLRDGRRVGAVISHHPSTVQPLRVGSALPSGILIAELDVLDEYVKTCQVFEMNLIMSVRPVKHYRCRVCGDEHHAAKGDLAAGRSTRG